MSSTSSTRVASYKAVADTAGYLVTIREASQILGIKAWPVCELIADGTLHVAGRFGEALLVPRSEVERHLARRQCGDVIRVARQAQNMTKTDLSVLSGVSRSTITPERALPITTCTTTT